MMKKLLLLSAIAIIFIACQNKNGYTINGEVNDANLEGKQVTLSKIVGDDQVVMDSTIITNNKFTFKGETETPVLYFISLNDAKSIVVAEPGKINIAYDDAGFKTSGTPINNEFNEFNSKQKDLNEEMKSISTQYREADSDGSMTEELKEELINKMNEVRDNGKSSYLDLIKSNINNELGQYMFKSTASMFDVEEQKAVLALASEAYKQDEQVKRIIEKIEAVEKVAIGKKFINLTMEDPKGNTVSLSDYVGKNEYVFIDFWASWCGPCRNEMPNVVEAYKKYKKKGLEIVGVSLDQDKEQWIKGIKDLNITWPQMSDLKVWESEAVKLYGIRGIPHTVLLDKEGTIIAKDLREEELHSKLSELLD